LGVRGERCGCGKEGNGEGSEGEWFR